MPSDIAEFHIFTPEPFDLLQTAHTLTVHRSIFKSSPLLKFDNLSLTFQDPVVIFQFQNFTLDLSLSNDATNHLSP